MNDQPESTYEKDNCRDVFQDNIAATYLYKTKKYCVVPYGIVDVVWNLYTFPLI